MPKMGGVDALKLLKDDPATADIPVIVISALSQSNEQKLIAAGAQCYVEKVRANPESLPEIVTRKLRTMQRQSRTYSPARDNAAVR
jgi:CheY-like chemotaxis protein